MTVLNKLQQRLSHFDELELSPVFSRTTLLFLVLVYFCLTALASRRLLWHDELFTYYIATAPSLSQFWREVGLDLNPPLGYLLARASIKVLGASAFAVRLPSIIAFLVGSLCLSSFVSRRLGRPYGWLGMLVLWASPFFYYATEARPYALVLGFFGFALVAWQRIIENDRRIPWACLLGVAVTGMMLSHLMAIFYIAPFCLAELMRSYRRRKLDPAVCAALLTPYVVPFIYLHLVTRFESTSFPPAFQASFRRVIEFYFGTLKLEALPLMFALGLALWIANRTGKPAAIAPETRMTSVEAMLTAGLISLPVIIGLVLMPLHSAFFDRYAFPIEFGYALIVTFFLSKYAGRGVMAPLAACTVLLIFIGAYQLGPGRKESVWSGPASITRSDGGAQLDRIHPDLPLVAASGLTFLEMDHYADAPTLNRLYYLTDRTLAVRYADATIFEGLPKIKQYFPIRAKIAPYTMFTNEHPAFLVLGTPDYPEDWLLRELIDTGANVRYLGEVPGPYKDKQIYQVTIPAK